MKNTKRVYALIGGIASGKTAVSNILAELGAYIIDADIVSRAVTAPGTTGEKKVLEAFPSCVSGGTFDRKALRSLVFSDKKELEKLNAITHPLIIREIRKQIDEHSGIIVSVMPIPVELRRYHAVLNVYTPPQMRIARLKKRDNISDELAEKIIASQLSDEKFAEAADYTFVNDGDEQSLRRAVTKWWNSYIEE